MEGHPDNAGALIRWIFIGCQTDESVDAVVFEHDVDFEIVAVVPNEELLTIQSRGVLPTGISFKAKL